MSSNLELRTAAIKTAIEAFETERDKLLDQVAHLRGHSDRLEWVIRVLLAQVTRIEQEESELQKKQQLEEVQKRESAELEAQRQVALALAKQAGNIGSHPTERKKNLAARKKQPNEESGT